MAITDPVESLDWINRLESLQSVDLGWNSMMSALRVSDLTLAKEIALESPTQELATLSIVDVATTISQDSPQDALNWVLSLGNENALEMSGANILPNWIQSNSASAIEWVSNAKLSERSRKFFNGFLTGSPSPIFE